jgi:NIPSNAP protein
MTHQYRTAACLAIVAFAAGAWADRAIVKAQMASRVFELRTYTAGDGQLDPLAQRFKSRTIPLLARHGMPLVGFWTAIDAPKSANTLVYILSHPSRDAADRSWKAFDNDPEWKALLEQAKSGPAMVKSVETMFLRGTDFSPLK